MLPDNKDEAHKLRRMTVHFVFYDDVLYKKGYFSPLVRCTSEEDANYVLHEIHEDVCDNHIEELALAHKVLR